tara:strand:+ start:1671 stop:1922 length:252 start_codon:yes stop_codon:yes gene_type:complete
MDKFISGTIQRGESTISVGVPIEAVTSDNVEACLSDLKMRRERDPISRIDREIRREARYTYEDIRYLLELQKESIIRSMTPKS